MTAAALDDGGQATRPVDSIAVVDRHRTDLGDISALATSIATEGLLHPVVITTSGRMTAIAWSFVGLIAVAGLLAAVGTVRADRRDRERQR